MIRKHTQQGVALIFALGILSLILVMGVAFLGNALITQKIAVNSREAAASRYVADNALNRALSQLTLFNLLQSGHHAAYYASDASSVYSRIATGDAAAAGAEGTAVAQDQLGGAGSKLNVNTRFSTTWYQGQQSPARWIYIHQNGQESDGSGKIGEDDVTSPIVGRFAYQVLPQTSASRLSLYGVTSGVTGIAGETPAASNPRKPHTHRWGIDADELVIPNLGSMFSQYWGTGASQALTPQHEFDNFQNLLSGSSAPNPFKGNTKTVENRRRWLRHIFVEGRDRVAREAYSDGSAWYPRFNLSDLSGEVADMWYSRLLSKAEASALDKGASVINGFKNAAAALNRLTAVPGTGDKYYDGYIDDSDYTHAIGLPFLRAIGSSGEKHSFLKTDGTTPDMENFRKQIAANLNDYCDSDSVPTSNVPPANWGSLINQTTGLPAYTGNEKTLCINEVAFGFRLHKSKFQIEGGKCIFKPFISSDGSKTNKLRAELIVELVEPYRGLPESYETMRLEGRLKSLKLLLKVSIKGKVRVRRTGEDADAEVDLGDDGIETTKEATLSTPRSFTINKQGVGSASYEGKFGFRRTGRYWVGRATLNEYADPCDVDFTEAIKEKDGKGKDITVTSISDVSDIKVEVLKVSFELANLALFLKDTASSPTVDNYVDFVRVTPGERVTEPESPFKVFAPPCGGGDADGWLKLNKLTSETAKDSGKCYFYGGSMQAIDPRQNLFARLGNTAKNDWTTVFTPTLADVTGGTPEWDSLDARKVGAKNVYSDPSAPKYADGTARPSGTYDTETATDPAWLGDTAGQHISTAVIRNKPMRSPWELGFIHRAIPFQTINLKKAGGIGNKAGDEADAALAEDAHDPANFAGWTEEEGTTYTHGDAGILDQIKMTESNKSWGKLDMSVLRNNAPAWWITDGETAVKDLNKNIFLSLFQNQRTQLPWQFLTESDNLKTVPVPETFNTVKGDALSTAKAEDVDVTTIPDTRLRSKILAGGEGALQTAFENSGANDAAKEEFIGKTVNLLEGRSCSLPSVFRIIIVAQTIRDLTDSVTKVDSAGTAHTATAAAGKFDLSGGIYYDDILSECRMLVTVEKVAYDDGTTQREMLKVKQVEYLD